MAVGGTSCRPMKIGDWKTAALDDPSSIDTLQAHWKMTLRTKYVSEMISFFFWKINTKNVTHRHNIWPPALYLSGWYLTLLPSQLRHHLDITASQQEACSPAEHQLEGRAPPEYCGEGSCSSLHLIENTRNRSCSGHPSGAEAMSDGGGGTEAGRSPRDRFHLFTGGISVTGSL